MSNNDQQGVGMDRADRATQRLADTHGKKTGRRSPGKIGKTPANFSVKQERLMTQSSFGP
jgi:hypothetical protein